MHTISTVRAETRTRSIPAPPEAVFAVIADGARLPEWAPAFASAAEHEGDERWLITSGDVRFPVSLRADAAAGTADLIRPGDTRRGAFLRVTPNGDGAELAFTLLLGDPAFDDPAVLDAQMATVEAELEAIGHLAAAEG
ncbi:MAG TPA: SRPBCC family protein [Baekduia sp.]|uniref:SRPBCC family protein n=1 Tax=Baekduia sp. TaxID=2600305 RepID=UPI002D77B9EF|nr:SRPBCC family protein [Baekduia sp.]HET6509588.1 SRPBCC family protein [Baekduia sp.]